MLARQHHAASSPCLRLHPWPTGVNTHTPPPPHVQDRAANWFPPPLMACLLSLAGLRTLVLGLGPRFTYDHGLWQGSRAFTALTALGGLRRLDVHDLSSDIRGAFQEHAPHCRFNHHQYFRAE